MVIDDPEPYSTRNARMMTCRDSAVRAEQSASAHSVQNNGQCEDAHVNVSLTPLRLLSHPRAVTCWPGGENRAQIGLFKCEFETGVEFGYRPPG